MSMAAVHHGYYKCEGSGRMIRKIMQTAAVFLLTGVLAVMAVTTYVTVPDEPAADEETQAEEAGTIESVTASSLAGRQDVYVTVLGDSIAKGYSGDENVVIEPYSSLAMRQMAAEEDFQYEITNYARNGLDSAGMNDKILTDEEVCDSVSRSDVIFITVGSNDLLNECKSAVQEILDTDTKFKSAGEALKALRESAAGNPLLVLKIIETLEQWDYQMFEANWIEMMHRIDGMKKEGAWIIVTNIYNPVANLNIPSTMDRGVENVIRNMNQIIEKYAEEYGYQVADIFSSEVCDHVQPDGLHPDQTGQQIIADQICGE